VSDPGGPGPDGTSSNVSGDAPRVSGAAAGAPPASVTPSAAQAGSTAAASPRPRALLLQRDEEVKRSDAAFPMLTVAEEELVVTEYVELLWAGRRDCFRTDRRTRAKGRDKIGVSSSAFGGAKLPSDATATWVPATSWRWHRARLRSDRALRIAAFGLLLASVGVGIDAALAIGKVKPLIPFSDPWLMTFTALKFVLQAVGLVLAFWKGVLDSAK
jgi:hypothetical protein